MPLLSRRSQFVLAIFNLALACTDFGEFDAPPAPRTWGGGGAFKSPAPGSGGTSFGGRSVGGAATGRTAEGAAGHTATGGSGGDATAGKDAAGRGGAGAGTGVGAGSGAGARASGGATASSGRGGAGAESGAGPGGTGGEGGEGGEGSGAGSLGTGAATGPFISEYVEGSSAGGNIKALEIAVQSAGALAGCKINVYANGLVNADGLPKLSRTIPLAETVTPSAPLVICSPELLAPACRRTESLPFNGNDAILLYCDAAVVDAFGRLGEDPGERGWLSEGFATTDITLRRSCAVMSGDVNAVDAFAPAAEWLSAGTDVIDDLGTHCNPADPAATGAGGTAGNGTAGAASSGLAGAGSS